LTNVLRKGERSWPSSRGEVRLWTPTGGPILLTLIGRGESSALGEVSAGIGKALEAGRRSALFVDGAELESYETRRACAQRARKRSAWTPPGRWRYNDGAGQPESPWQASMRWSIDNRVGRLVEIVMESRMTVDETAQFRTRMWSVLSQIAGKAVIVVDMRRAEMFGPDVAERLLQMLKTDNPKVERSAYVLEGNASFAMQVERIIREAAQSGDKNRVPMRQTFRDKRQAQAFAAELLDAAERAQLERFMATM
jgi:hypothetical protein